MKMRLVADNRVPFGGEYRIDRPDLGLVGKGYIFSVLMKSLRDYRAANSIPIGLGFEEEVEKVLCEQMPQECEPADPKKRRKRRAALSDVIMGARVMLKHWWNGRQLVSREEAERRAQICVNCVQNTAFDKPCGGVCGELQEIVSAITNGQGTRFDANLHQCGVCHCFLQASVWVPLDIQCGVVTDDQKEEFAELPHCWKQCNTKEP